jgi:hypothetical protein
VASRENWLRVSVGCRRVFVLGARRWLLEERSGAPLLADDMALAEIPEKADTDRLMVKSDGGHGWCSENVVRKRYLKGVSS